MAIVDDPIVDDARLKELAAPRPKDLFPILDRSVSLWPLLVVLTVLPGIVALEFASIDEFDAQWRLKSLEISTAGSPLEFVDPSGISQTDLRWQPPLESWIAAAAVHLPDPIGSHGLELVDYLSAASLVPASYFLMARLLGRRVAFLTGLLVALHTTFLEQHQDATPHALAILTALGTFWGFIGHLWRGDDLVSTDLLVGGISLGLCLLAGGPLAFAVLAVLALLILGDIEPPAGLGRRKGVRSRRIGSSWSAFRSLGILAATAFAAGGWWELMMLYSYGGEFLADWLWGLPRSWRLGHASGAPLALASDAFWLRLLHDFFAMARMLSGLTLLGIWSIGRALVRFRAGTGAGAGAGSNISLAAEVEKRTPPTVARFLASWVGCALVLFAAGLRDPAPGSLYLGMWRLFLMSACAAASALALDAIAQRRIGIPLFATITIATLVIGFSFLHQGERNKLPLLAIAAAGLVFAVVAGQVLRRVSQQSESRQWVVLAGLIGSYVVADAWIGISAIRTDDPNWRALTTFRRSLPHGIDAEVCVLISDTEAPYRLQLALKSVWPEAKIERVRDWDEALKVAVTEGQTPKVAVVVDWSHGNSRPANPTGAQWSATPLGNPQFFESRQLRAYVLVWQPKPAGEADRPDGQAAGRPEPRGEPTLIAINRAPG